ncbi:MAG TPA: phosphatase PAP2 family protein [Solirubrobacterales bacterium]
MARNVKAPLAGWFVCTAGLIFVALVAYGTGSAQRLDAAVLARFVGEAGPRADSLATGLTLLGDLPALLLMGALACGVGWARGRPRSAMAALVIVAGANLTTQALKLALSHPRARELLGAENTSWDGFPSGHVTAVASVVIAFAFVVPQRLLPTVAGLGACLAAAMGWSVLVLNWHYPSDAVGAILVASSWGFAVLASMRFAAAARPRPPAQLSRRAAISLK